MDRHLQRLQQQITAVLDFSTELPQERRTGKWSTAEILEHLYLTYTGTIKGFERVLAVGKPLASTATLKQRMQALVVLGFGYLPTGRVAPRQAQPRGLPPEEVLSKIGQKIAEMDEIMTRCDAKLGLGARVLDHPFLGPFTTQQWRRFHLVHGLHHLKQIRELREIAARKNRD